MSDNTTIFLLGYLRETQWASALRESKDGLIDSDRVKELMQEQREAYNLDTVYIARLVTDDELFKHEMKQDKV